MRLLRATFAQLRRIHPFTWCVTLLVTVPMVLIVVPGIEIDTDWRHDDAWHQRACTDVYKTTVDRFTTPKGVAGLGEPDGWARLYEHGWPWPYLVRTLGSTYSYPVSPTSPVSSRQWSRPLLQIGESTDALPISWSSRDNWPLESDEWKFHIWRAALSLLVLLGVAGVIAAATEWWLHTRGGLFRFRILDALMVITLVALILAWHQGHVRAARTEARILAELNTNPFEFSLSSAYEGPHWLRLLVGNRELLPSLHHVNRAEWHEGSLSGWGDPNEAEEVGEAVGQLPCLKWISMPNRADIQYVRRLMTRQPQAALEVHFDTYDPFNSNSTLAVDRDDSTLDVTQLNCLGDLSISKLWLHGGVLLAEDIEVVAGFANLEELWLFDASVLAEELDAIRTRHPHVTIIARWGGYDPYGNPDWSPPADHEDRVNAMKLSRQKQQSRD